MWRWMEGREGWGVMLCLVGCFDRLALPVLFGLLCWVCCFCFLIGARCRNGWARVDEWDRMGKDGADLLCMDGGFCRMGVLVVVVVVIGDWGEMGDEGVEGLTLEMFWGKGGDVLGRGSAVVMRGARWKRYWAQRKDEWLIGDKDVGIKLR